MAESTEHRAQGVQGKMAWDSGLHHHHHLFLFSCVKLYSTIEFPLQQHNRERGDLKRTNTRWGVFWAYYYRPGRKIE